MIHLEDKAIESIAENVRMVLHALGRGMPKTKVIIYAGDDVPIATMYAHWSNDLLAIDVIFE